MLIEENENQAYHGDHDLWEAFKLGDQHAYANIYQNHADALFKYGMQLCGEAELVEDVIHDIFFEIWAKRKRLAEVKSIRLYLKFSLRRGILRKLRKNRLLQNDDVLHQNSFKFTLRAEALALEAEHYHQMEKKLLSALNSLSSRQREVIYLRFYQDMSYEEIADLLELEIGYVYNVSSRAYSKIKASLCSMLLSFIFFIQNGIQAFP